MRGIREIWNLQPYVLVNRRLTRGFSDIFQNVRFFLRKTFQYLIGNMLDNRVLLGISNDDTSTCLILCDFIERIFSLDSVLTLTLY